MTEATVFAELERPGTTRPMIGPLVTSSARSARWATYGPVSLPPLRVQARTPWRESADPLIPAAEIRADWRDDSLSSLLGETEPEDELPLLRDSAAYAVAAARAVSPASIHDAIGTSVADPAHLDEIAARLEAIARVLREQGPPGLLLTGGRDPLGALITGYLVGYLEGGAARDAGGSG